MRRLSLLLLAVLVALPVFAADAAVGVWNSEERFNGQPRVVVELREDGGKITGNIEMRGVTDDDNNVTTQKFTIDGVERSGSKIVFKAKGQEEYVADWEIEIDGDQAVASIVGDSDGPYTDAQRFKMKRARS